MSSSISVQANTPTAEEGELYGLSMFELIIWCVLYAIIALMTVAGNLLVLYITFFRLRAEWFLPYSLCKIVPYAETVSLSVSVFTLTASAIHEFRAVFFPKRGQMSSKSARNQVILIWLVAVVVSLPHGLFHQVYIMPEVDNSTTPQCRPVYAEDYWWKFYNIYLTIIHYFVPMLILDTAYTMIAFKIWAATQASTDESPTLKQAKPVANEISNKKLMKMLIIVVFCFSVCWLPLESYLLLNEVRPEINSWKYINIFFFCAHWLAMSNSCLNPIIYGIFNTKYSREYRLFFGSMRCRPLSENNGEDSSKFDTETCMGNGTNCAVEMSNNDEFLHLNCSGAFA
ncbi:unnamed protein product [Caenorhabditis auriculariae]|uniref:G-protein coupled receptors family 1 profile domain-containing protein n=1 Tax=Caenorhabditis auriculariae TaxID=2777116 RepID=A0A8S1HGK6_9PELO|nr:unnamed protein product [Caenorhabditis auriculariae]